MIDQNEHTQPPIDVQRILVHQEIDMWVRTRSMARVRLRVQTAIDGEAETRAAHAQRAPADLEKCEKALDALAQDLAALPGEETAWLLLCHLA